jgi:DNA-binding MarR family transcriptional regulator
MSDVVESVLERHGFTFIQYVILSWPRDCIALNPRDISLEFRHNSGALTRVIDQLVERGLPQRLRRGRDRRKVQLQLTAAGREAIKGLVLLFVERLDAALADFSDAEVQELLHLLIKLNTTLQSVTEPGMARPSVHGRHLDGGAVSRVTLLLAVGGSFDPRASGGLADTHQPEPPSGILTQIRP